MKRICVLLLIIFAIQIQAADDPQKKMQEILGDTPLIDGHNDLPWAIRDNFKNHLAQVNLNDTTKQEKPFQTDIPRLRKGLVGGQFWSVYVPSDLPGYESLRAVMEQIDITKRFVQAYPDTFELALTAQQIRAIHKNGKIASMIGIEGGHCIVDSLAVLRQLYDLGARYMTLTHWQSTAWADSATADPKYGGLTPFGEKVIHEMNRLGMLVDLSHVSEQTMNRTLDVTKSPVLFSHSSCRAISQHVRNVPDEVLKRLPANGGVVLINFAPSFVSEKVRLFSAEQDAAEARFKELFLGKPEENKKAFEEWKKQNPSPQATLSEVADHIDHVRKIAGIDYVGLGSDLDGITTTPVGLEDVSKYPDLLAELLRRGYSKEDIRKVAGENALRVIQKNEEVAAELQKNTQPDDTLIGEMEMKK